MQIQSKRFKILSAMILGAVLTAAAANGAASGAEHSSSQLPAGLAETVGRTLGLPTPSDAAQFKQEQELKPNDGAPTGGRFGYSVALSGNGRVALVGAYAKDGGAAYLFTQHDNTWTEQQELQAFGHKIFDGFGTSVAVNSDGSIALIGAPYKNIVKGAAYLFVQHGNTWTEQQELPDPDGTSGDSFGYSVALDSDGGIALISSGKDSQKGAAYVFAKVGNTWTQQQELQASDGVSYDKFGASVALNGDGRIALIGASFKNVNNYNTGAAYVFAQQGNTWIQQQELQPPDGVFGGFFGSALALSKEGQVALIGSFFKRAGAAYLFAQQNDTWSLQQELQPSDGGFYYFFGYSVALSSDAHVALISAIGNNSFAGAAYIFTQYGNTWTEQQELQPSDGVANGQFGLSVALNNEGGIALIGASSFHDSATDAACLFTEH